MQGTEWLKRTKVFLPRLAKLKLYKLFISYSDKHLRNRYQKEYTKVHNKSASVQQIQSLVNWKSQPQTVFGTFMHLLCPGFRKRGDSVCGSPKKGVLPLFPHSTQKRKRLSPSYHQSSEETCSFIKKIKCSIF